MTEHKLLQQALVALEDLGMKHYELTGEVLYKETFADIREALAQPEQDWERVARIKEEMLRVSFEDNKRLKEALAHTEQERKNGIR